MARTVEVKPQNDAYTGLLAISFLALVAACILMALDANELGTAPPKLNVDVPGATPGKAGEGLRRPDAAKEIPPGPADKGGGGGAEGKEKAGGMSRRTEPSKLPDLPESPAIDVPA
ncbi:MAG: hypothetical protein J2P46_23005, partial [Zavarzinella sp.]|nr:hypothetical protein [Zavarzinella sp.]